MLKSDLTTNFTGEKLCSVDEDTYTIKVLNSLHRFGVFKYYLRTGNRQAKLSVTGEVMFVIRCTFIEVGSVGCEVTQGRHMG